MKELRLLFFVTLTATGIGTMIYGISLILPSTLAHAAKAVVAAEVIYWACVLIVIGWVGSFRSLTRRY